MTTTDMRRTKQALERLKGQPIQYVHRAVNMLTMGLGPLTPKLMRRLNEKKQRVEEMTDIAEFALHISSSFRLSCGDTIILAKQDMYQPTDAMEADPEFDWDAFHWDTQGGNRLDQLVAQFLGTPCRFIVKEVAVSRLGDVRLSLNDGFLLEVFCDGSGADECWRVFPHGTDDHLVVTGLGLRMMRSEVVRATRRGRS